MAAPGDLCTRSEVLAALSDPQSPDLDMIDRLITAASAALVRYSGREFATLDVDEEVAYEGTGTDTAEVVTYVAADDVIRRFAVHAPELHPDDPIPVGDMATAPTRIDIVSAAGVMLDEDIDLAGVEPWPLNRRPWEPITGLRLHGRTLTASMRIDVTSTWGFPQVPADVRQACIAQVREWYVRDPSRFGSAFADAEGGIDVPSRELSLVARDAVRAYRVPVVA